MMKPMEVIQGKFRASLEPLWAMKIAKYVCMYGSNSRIYPANTL